MAIKVKTSFAGFKGEQQLTPWDLRRDKVYSTTRRMMMALPKEKRTGFEIRTQPYIQKIEEVAA